MPRERLISLDLFRGATVAGMLLVNNPGTWASIYPPLRHAPWHGWTPTDLIFPFFLFIVGITTELSLSARRDQGASETDMLRQILRRGFLIILFGLLLNAFPFYTWGKVEGVSDPTFLQRIADRFEHLRWSGVLQRIGIVYLATALLTLRTSLRQQIGVLVTLLVGYWLAMTLLPVPGSGLLGGTVLDKPDATLAAWLDRLVLAPNHIWKAAKTWDPEGPLSTLPAIGTALLGVFAGRWIGQPRPLAERLSGLFAAGSLGMVAGLIWHWIFPINKNLWTSSYVVFTGGMAAVVLATCMWIVDLHGFRRWTTPFVVFGMNPIAAFVGSGLMARFTDSLIKVPMGGRSVTLHLAIYQTLLASWLAPVNASLAYAILFVLVWLIILGVMARRGWVLKV